MKILAFSDIHRNTRCAQQLVEASKNADVLVGAGDFATRGEGALDVLAILAKVTIPAIIVPGNHDSIAGLLQFCQGWKTGYLLHGSGLVLGGVSFFGLGCEIPRYNQRSWNEYLSEAEAAAILSKADPFDVLITHTPPLGHVDVEVDDDHNGGHDGSASILRAVEERQPRLHLCGHMHDSWGQTSKIGKTSVHNLGPSLNWFTV